MKHLNLNVYHSEENGVSNSTRGETTRFSCMFFTLQINCGISVRQLYGQTSHINANICSVRLSLYHSRSWFGAWSYSYQWNSWLISQAVISGR